MEENRARPKSYEVIGAYVTTGALFKLYSYLDALRTTYYDTDSVIYVQKCGQPPAVTCGDGCVT